METELTHKLEALTHSIQQTVRYFSLQKTFNLRKNYETAEKKRQSHSGIAC